MPLLRRAQLQHGVWREVLLDRNTLRQRRDARYQRARLTEPQTSTDVIVSQGLRLRHWIASASWGWCDSCHSVFARPLEDNFWRSELSLICGSSCPSCTGVYVVPDVRDVPLCLQGLPVAVVFALRPFDVHLGDFNPGHPQGYRRHTGAFKTL